MLNSGIYTGNTSPVIWNLTDWSIYHPYSLECKNLPDNFNNEKDYGRDYIPYGYYYKNGLPIRPVTDEEPSGRDKLVRFFNYNTLDSGDSNITVDETKEFRFLDYDKNRSDVYELSNVDKRIRYNDRYEKKRRLEEIKERKERENEWKLRQEARERARLEREQERERERERRQEEKERKQRIWDDWYNEYITIEVNYKFHVIEKEYNQNYWESRSEDICVRRREAQELVRGGRDAIMGRVCYGDSSLIRGFNYRYSPYLFGRPLGV